MSPPPIQVNLTYTGTAVDGTDFTGVASVTIAAGSNSATFNIATIDDALVEGTENFTVTLGTISGGNFRAIAADSANNSVTTTINDDDDNNGNGDAALVCHQRTGFRHRR